MNTQNEPITATVAQNIPHDPTKREFAKVLMDLRWKKDALERDDGSEVDGMAMQCMACGHFHVIEKPTSERWKPRYYTCENRCNSFLWTPKEHRIQEWACIMMGNLVRVLMSELSLEGVKSLIPTVADMADTVRDPHQYDRLWVEAIWGVEHVIFEREKSVGETPRIIAAYNILAHLAEYDPWERVEKSAAALFANAIHEVHIDIKREILKRKNPHLVPSALTYAPLNPPHGLKSTIMNALAQ